MILFRTDYKLTSSIDFIRPSLQLLKDNIWPFLYLFFVPNLIATVGIVLAINIDMAANSLIWDDRTKVGLMLFGTGLLWSLATYPGVIIAQMQAIHGKEPTAFDCFKQGLKYIFPMLWLNVLRSTAVFFGILALIVPGLFIIRSFYLAEYYLIDRKLGAMESLKTSRAESLPNAGYIWGTIGIVMLFGVFSNAVVNIPVAGYVLAQAIALLYIFGPALRYQEITQLKLKPSAASPTSPAKKPRQT